MGSKLNFAHSWLHGLFAFSFERGVFCSIASQLWGDSVICPICQKRKAARFCSAKGEQICAICCGREREVTIDCPVDCPHLLAAHRYEAEHPRTLPPDTPLLDLDLPSDIVHTQQHLMAAFAYTISKFCASHREATDSDLLASLRALAETYKTLRTGIYYEKPPDARLPRKLYAALTAFIAEAKQEQAGRTGFSALKDSDIFHLLVFLYRMGLLQTNGRPRSRRYVEFLRSQFPDAKELQREEPRLVIP
jgi:hypothetical protein